MDTQCAGPSRVRSPLLELTSRTQAGLCLDGAGRTGGWPWVHRKGRSQGSAGWGSVQILTWAEWGSAGRGKGGAMETGQAWHPRLNLRVGEGGTHLCPEALGPQLWECTSVRKRKRPKPGDQAASRPRPSPWLTWVWLRALHRRTEASHPDLLGLSELGIFQNTPLGLSSCPALLHRQGEGSLLLALKVRGRHRLTSSRGPVPAALRGPEPFDPQVRAAPP